MLKVLIVHLIVGSHCWSYAPQDVVEKNFVQLTYADAVELLLKAKKKFDFPVGVLYLHVFWHATFGRSLSIHSSVAFP